MKSFKGKDVDMSTLLEQQSKTIAVGNMRVNARGDLVGKGGKIVKTREQLENEYVSKNPNAVKQKVENAVGFNKGFAAYRDAVAQAEKEQPSIDPFKETSATNPNLDTKSKVKFVDTQKVEEPIVEEGSLDSLPLDDEFEISDDPTPKTKRGTKNA